MSQILPFLSMGMQITSGYAQGKAQQAQANAEASMMETNASYYKQQGEAARASALWDERILRERVAAVASTQRAKYGASGVALDEGSPVDVMLETIRRGELDAIAIRTGGAREYSANIEQSQTLRRQAGYTRRVGATYPSMGLMSGVTSAFSTGMQTGAFGNWGIGSSNSSSTTTYGVGKTATGVGVSRSATIKPWYLLNQ